MAVVSGAVAVAVGWVAVAAGWVAVAAGCVAVGWVAVAAGCVPGGRVAVADGVVVFRPVLPAPPVGDRDLVRWSPPLWVCLPEAGCAGGVMRIESVPPVPLPGSLTSTLTL